MSMSTISIEHTCNIGRVKKDGGHQAYDNADDNAGEASPIKMAPQRVVRSAQPVGRPVAQLSEKLITDDIIKRIHIARIVQTLKLFYD